VALSVQRRNFLPWMLPILFQLVSICDARWASQDAYRAGGSQVINSTYPLKNGMHIMDADASFGINTFSEDDMNEDAFSLSNAVLLFGVGMFIVYIALGFLLDRQVDRMYRTSLSLKDVHRFWRMVNLATFLQIGGKRSWPHLWKMLQWKTRRQHPWLSTVSAHPGDFLTSFKRLTILVTLLFNDMTVVFLLLEQDIKLPFCSGTTSQIILTTFLAFPVPYIISWVLQRAPPGYFFVDLSNEFSFHGCLPLALILLSDADATAPDEETVKQYEAEKRRNLMNEEKERNLGLHKNGDMSCTDPQDHSHLNQHDHSITLSARKEKKINGKAPEIGATIPEQEPIKAPNGPSDPVTNASDAPCVANAANVMKITTTKISMKRLKSTDLPEKGIVAITEKENCDFVPTTTSADFFIPVAAREVFDRNLAGAERKGVGCCGLRSKHDPRTINPDYTYHDAIAIGTCILIMWGCIFIQAVLSKKLQAQSIDFVIGWLLVFGQDFMARLCIIIAVQFLLFCPWFVYFNKCCKNDKNEESVDKKPTDIVVKFRPGKLGFDFKKRQVVHVMEGQAKELGIESDWQIISVDGVEVADDEDIDLKLQTAHKTLQNFTVRFIPKCGEEQMQKKLRMMERKMEDYASFKGVLHSVPMIPQSSDQRRVSNASLMPTENKGLEEVQTVTSSPQIWAQSGSLGSGQMKADDNNRRNWQNRYRSALIRSGRSTGSQSKGSSSSPGKPRSSEGAEFLDILCGNKKESDNFRYQRGKNSSSKRVARGRRVNLVSVTEERDSSLRAASPASPSDDLSDEKSPESGSLTPGRAMMRTLTQSKRRKVRDKEKMERVRSAIPTINETAANEKQREEKNTKKVAATPKVKSPTHQLLNRLCRKEFRAPSNSSTSIPKQASDSSSRLASRLGGREFNKSGERRK